MLSVRPHKLQVINDHQRQTTVLLHPHRFPANLHRGRAPCSNSHGESSQQRAACGQCRVAFLGQFAAFKLLNVNTAFGGVQTRRDFFLAHLKADHQHPACMACNVLSHRQRKGSFANARSCADDDQLPAADTSCQAVKAGYAGLTAFAVIAEGLKQTCQGLCQINAGLLCFDHLCPFRKLRGQLLGAFAGIVDGLQDALRGGCYRPASAAIIKDRQPLPEHGGRVAIKVRFDQHASRFAFLAGLCFQRDEVNLLTPR